MNDADLIRCLREQSCGCRATAADRIEELQAEIERMKEERDKALSESAALRTKLFGAEPYDEHYDGLKLKYRVFKVKDGTLVGGCFVLRPDKEYAAREALRRYAYYQQNLQLRKDIVSWVGETELLWPGPRLEEGHD